MRYCYFLIIFWTLFCVESLARKRHLQEGSAFTITVPTLERSMTEDVKEVWEPTVMAEVRIPLKTLSAAAQAYRDSLLEVQSNISSKLDQQHKKLRLEKSARAAYDEGYEHGYEDGSNRQRNESFAPKTRKDPYFSHYREGYAEGYHDGYMDTVEDYAIDGIEDDDDAEWDDE